MTLPPEVLALLRRVARALAWTQALVWGTRGVGAAAGASLLLVAVGTILPLPISPLLVLGAGLTAAGAAALLRGLVPARSLLAVAHVADARLGLAERLSTAVDLAAGRIQKTALAQAVMADATRRASAVVPGAAFRIRPPVSARWTALTVVAALLASLSVGGLTLPATPARQKAAQIRSEGRRLEQVARRLEQVARTERVPEARRAAQQVRQLARDLQRPRVDRVSAESRLAALERQLEGTRQQLSERIGPASPRPRLDLPDALFRSPAMLDQPIRQLRELAARLADSQGVQGERRDLLQQLSSLSQAGEGQMPAAVRGKVEEARRQVEAGNAAAGRETLTQALEDLEALRAMMADEQALSETARELQRSAQRIARGAPGGKGQEEEGLEGDNSPASAPGRQRLIDREEDSPGALPPKGPHEGSTPGQGRAPEKLGAQTPRLEASGERSRVRGQEARGGLQTSEILGPGRRQPARTRVVKLSPAVVRRADEHMARARIPADLRSLVRRYFEQLARRP